jgi:integrase
MAYLHPFLQRRGGTLHFRIQVPTALRRFIGQREFTKTLKTGEHAKALPLALNLGSVVKQLFQALRQPNMATSDMLDLLKAARAKLDIDGIKVQHLSEIEEIRGQHLRELREARLQARVDALERLMERSPRSIQPITSPQPVLALAPPKPVSDLTLAKVVGNFLATYPHDKHSEMFKKHQPALKLLCEIIGDKSVSDLRQSDFNGFFDCVARLPPRWAAECKRKGISPVVLSKKNHPTTIGPKTFDDNYVVPVRLFLKAAIVNWQDQGFPTTLTTESIQYRGNREEGENKQRAFTKPELERLFDGPELAAFKNNPKEAHMWWLPVIGLYTGARVNEICQLNPQSDVCVEPDSGVQYFWITATTESDSRVKKSVKNASSRRKVPIHSTLVQLGLLDYVESMKTKGAKLIFPSWSPNNRRASTQAEKWFREHLSSIGLRDDTPFAKITGMHAFRHTLLARASNSSPRIDAGPITGHSGDVNSDQRGYEGELSLKNKKRLLEGIEFGFAPRAAMPVGAARPTTSGTPTD